MELDRPDRALRRVDGSTQRFAAPVLLTMAFRPLDPADTRPVYIQLADRIRDAIRDGHLPQARPLPVARALVAHYGVSRFTLTRAVGLLADEGIVRTVNGVRTFVCGMPPPEPDGLH